MTGDRKLIGPAHAHSDGPCTEACYEDRPSVWFGRNQGTQHFEPLFGYGHLPEGDLREASALCAELAEAMVCRLPDGPELSAGLRKLLEAKDCFVRSAVLASGPR